MIIEGKNAIKEALNAGKSVDKLYVLKGYTDSSVQYIIDKARENNSRVLFVDKKTLDKLTPQKHQNVVAQISEFDYVRVEDIIDYAKSKGEKLFLLILDGIEDPHNLGNIIRTAEIAGVHGIVIPKVRSVGVTETVIRVSSGASHHMKIAKVGNINDTLRALKDLFINIYAADMKGEIMYSQNMKEDTAIVIGNEGSGIKPLTAKLSDKIISIPIRGNINSLNAASAAGIIMYEVVRQRLY